MTTYGMIKKKMEDFVADDSCFKNYFARKGMGAIRVQSEIDALNGIVDVVQNSSVIEGALRC